MAKANTLSDNFTTNSGAWTGLSTANVITGGQLRINYTTAYSTVSSISQFDLTESSVTVRVVINTGHANNETWFAFGDTGGVFDAANTIQMIVSSGTLYLRDRSASTSTDSTVAYNATTMAWWRIREASGTVYWETAPNSSGPWTVRRSKVRTWVPNQHYIKFSAGNFTATQATYAIYDDLNPTPAYNSGQFLPFF